MTEQKSKGVALLVFGEKLPKRSRLKKQPVSLLVAPRKLCDASGEWADIRRLQLEDWTDIGNVQEASKILEEISALQFTDGSRLAKQVLYEGFELWWIHQQALVLHFILPFLQYRRLLGCLVSFEKVILLGPFAHEKLFGYFFKAHKVCFINGNPRRVRVLHEVTKLRSFPAHALKLFYSLFSIFVLAIVRPKLVLWAGDILTYPKDYDFRLEHIYLELRKMNIRFAECFRSILGVRALLQNICVRKRPFFYSEGFERLCPWIYRIRARELRRRLELKILAGTTEEQCAGRFLTYLGMHFYEHCFVLIAHIQVLKAVLSFLGVKVVYGSTAYNRAAALIIASKLLKIPVVGLQHAAYNGPYVVFLRAPGFDGGRSYALDLLGVWSDFWKNDLLKNSRLATEENILVVGHQRPFTVPEIALEAKNNDVDSFENMYKSARIKVLLVSEPLVKPEEIIPYLVEIMRSPDLELAIKCRPEKTDNLWSLINPEQSRIRLYNSRIEDAILKSDVVIGAHSTALMEALFFLKPIVTLNTRKWGDYFEVESNKLGLFARSPSEVVESIRSAAKTDKEARGARKQYVWGNEMQDGAKVMVEIISRFLTTGRLRDGLKGPVHKMKQIGSRD